MKLSNFIRENIYDISAEWEKFAATLLPDNQFTPAELRNSIEELLIKIAGDMDSAQSGLQQSQKSKGYAESGAIGDAAEKHVVHRIHMGLSSQQLISEFRALRASVIRLWQKDVEVADQQDLVELTRFNEAVDEALTEAELRYSNKLKESRELALGILGHDLKNPINAIAGSAGMIRRTPRHERNGQLADQILKCTERMSGMVTNLMDLTRVSIGQGIPLNPAQTNLKALCLQVLEEAQAAYPSRDFKLEADDDLTGLWDHAKLSRVLANLLWNAAKHGFVDSEITIRACKAKNRDDRVEIQVHNEGPVIPETVRRKIFEKFVQERPNPDAPTGSMGLGLYIAKEIILAHGGSVDVSSSDKEGTTFYAFLPPAPPHASFRAAAASAASQAASLRRT